MVLVHQIWRHLLFLHWEIPFDALRPLIPAALEIDTFEERAYIGLVPFECDRSRLAFTPALPGVSHYLELNLRTYVKHRGEPGVYFFSLDASSAAITAAASAAYGLPYHHAEIEMKLTEENPPAIQFRSKRHGKEPANFSARYQAKGVKRRTTAGTLEHFLLERYVLFARDGAVMRRASVSHERYQVEDVDVTGVEETVVWAAKLKRPATQPIAHYVREVEVEISAPNVLETV